MLWRGAPQRLRVGLPPTCAPSAHHFLLTCRGEARLARLIIRVLSSFAPPNERDPLWVGEDLRGVELGETPRPGLEPLLLFLLSPARPPAARGRGQGEGARSKSWSLNDSTLLFIDPQGGSRLTLALLCPGSVYPGGQGTTNKEGERGVGIVETHIFTIHASL